MISLPLTSKTMGASSRKMSRPTALAVVVGFSLGITSSSEPELPEEFKHRFCACNH